MHEVLGPRYYQGWSAPGRGLRLYVSMQVVNTADFSWHWQGSVQTRARFPCCERICRCYGKVPKATYVVS